MTLFFTSLFRAMSEGNNNANIGNAPQTNDGAKLDTSRLSEQILESVKTFEGNVLLELKNHKEEMNHKVEEMKKQGESMESMVSQIQKFIDFLSFLFWLSASGPLFQEMKKEKRSIEQMNQKLELLLNRVEQFIVFWSTNGTLGTKQKTDDRSRHQLETSMRHEIQNHFKNCVMPILWQLKRQLQSLEFGPQLKEVTTAQIKSFVSTNQNKDGHNHIKEEMQIERQMLQTTICTENKMRTSRGLSFKDTYDFRSFLYYLLQTCGYLSNLEMNIGHPRNVNAVLGINNDSFFDNCKNDSKNDSNDEQTLPPVNVYLCCNINPHKCLKIPMLTADETFGTKTMRYPFTLVDQNEYFILCFFS
ncbi:hypothetical protein RFI_00406 [Reticulomyxa filosa]|uniref:Uncharacterized protein n=1 Tax=Reticulomyxa filosa TaxID=46433 RepID=X6PEJ8_RETFI|nr:hypothetical protein RFI_00406 [Reticulomyxa filosa]|eukprot:ETO36651.1 hypothetical protein RFI_00406 [Reticulomyxa filosa]